MRGLLPDLLDERRDAREALDLTVDVVRVEKRDPHPRSEIT